VSAIPFMRRWTDARDGTVWDVVFSPGVEEDTPAVRQLREGLTFRGAGIGEEFRTPSPYRWDLESLTDADLQGLLDQAREARALAREQAKREQEEPPPARRAAAGGSRDRPSGGGRPRRGR